MVVILRNSYFVSGGAQLRTQGFNTLAYMESVLYFNLMANNGPSITSTGTKPNINYNYGTIVSQAFIYPS